MSVWEANARKDYVCDYCKKTIRKGEKRVVDGYKCSVYVMIDRNYHFDCYKKVEGGERDEKDIWRKKNLDG